MHSIKSSKTIEVLRNLFASYGLPDELISDNGTQFISKELEQFLRRNGVKHRFSPPYNPATNGAAKDVFKLLNLS